MEQGRPIKGLLTTPDYRQSASFYATYAVNYISKLYPDVDYSKLKRDRRGYQQFLEELRKADPEAFAEQTPGPKQAATAH